MIFVRFWPDHLVYIHCTFHFHWTNIHLPLQMLIFSRISYYDSNVFYVFRDHIEKFFKIKNVFVFRNNSVISSFNRGSNSNRRLFTVSALGVIPCEIFNVFEQRTYPMEHYLKHFTIPIVSIWRVVYNVKFFWFFRGISVKSISDGTTILQQDRAVNILLSYTHISWFWHCKVHRCGA